MRRYSILTGTEIDPYPGLLIAAIERDGILHMLTREIIAGPDGGSKSYGHTVKHEIRLKPEDRGKFLLENGFRGGTTMALALMLIPDQAGDYLDRLEKPEGPPVLARSLPSPSGGRVPARPEAI